MEAIIQSIQLANIETNFVALNCAENDTQPLIEENFSSHLNSSSNTTEHVNVEISNITVLQNTQNLYCGEILDAQMNESSWHEISSGASGADFLQRFSLLTRDQKKVFQYVSNMFRKKTPIRIFITGGGGVGKSFLIHLLNYYITLSTSSFSGNSPVLVISPTDVAAFNVKGKTIHSALRLPVHHGYSYDASKLRAATLKQMRSDFQQVHTVIVDEISMVSTFMLEQIHLRLQAVRNNELPFGGFNMILVGDFFQLRPVHGSLAFFMIHCGHCFNHSFS